MIIWLIGLSASGKTTIGKKLIERLTMSNDKWVFLDGDTFRNILGEDLGHSTEDRRKNAFRISRLCEFLSTQNINVVACVLSIFHDNQQYNKDKIPNYKEIYIDVEFSELLKRDNKELYSKALKGEIKNVVGVDIDFKPPFSPDLIIDNNEQNSDFEDIISKIIAKFKLETENNYSYTRNNLLINPNKYQYSKYEGKAFFQKFIDDRESTNSFLVARLEKFKLSNFPDLTIDSITHKIKNSLILRDYLLNLLEGNKKNLDKNFSIIKVLIQRFEVSKKLYISYDSDRIRKNTQDYSELLNYPLFSLVLQKYYEFEGSEEKRLVYLNAILKNNDIISSIKGDIITPNEIKYSIRAINGELNIIRRYI